MFLLVSIASHPITGHLWEEWHHLLYGLQSGSFTHAHGCYLIKLFVIIWYCCLNFVAILVPSDTFILWGPKLGTVFQMWFHECRIKVNNHFPQSTDHVSVDTIENATGHLYCLGTSLAYVHLDCSAAASVIAEVLPSHVEDFTFLSFNIQRFLFGSFIYLV